MFKLTVKNTDIVICFSFVAVVTLCVLLYNEQIIIISVLSSLLHECGHIVAMKVSGVKIKELRLYGGGAKISAENGFISVKRELFIAFSGVAVNLILCVLFYKLFPLVFAVNLSILIFNLLPIGTLDGARALDIISDKYPVLNTPARLVKCIVSLLLAVLCAYSIFRFEISISVLVTVLFLTIGELLNKK
ncbi:MAG: hypothetical protein LUH57_07555 [Ruminococcus sp.]|nr:hypothetical protein [Ruminococcus sp.]